MNNSNNYISVILGAIASLSLAACTTDQLPIGNIGTNATTQENGGTSSGGTSSGGSGSCTLTVSTQTVNNGTGASITYTLGGTAQGELFWSSTLNGVSTGMIDSTLNNPNKLSTPLSYAGTAAGSYTVTAQVQPLNGAPIACTMTNTGTSSMVITVSAAPPPSCTLTASTQTVGNGSGSSITYTLGGTAQGELYWSSALNGVSTGMIDSTLNNPSKLSIPLSYAGTAAGSYTVTAQVQPLNGAPIACTMTNTGTSSMVITVSAAPPPNCTLTASALAVTNGTGAGSSLTFTLGGTTRGELFWSATLNGVSTGMFDSTLNNPSNLSTTLPYAGIPVGAYTITAEVKPSSGAPIACTMTNTGTSSMIITVSQSTTASATGLYLGNYYISMVFPNAVTDSTAPTAILNCPPTNPTLTVTMNQAGDAVGNQINYDVVAAYNPPSQLGIPASAIGRTCSIQAMSGSTPVSETAIVVLDPQIAKDVGAIDVTDAPGYISLYGYYGTNFSDSSVTYTCGSSTTPITAQIEIATNGTKVITSTQINIIAPNITGQTCQFTATVNNLSGVPVSYAFP